MEQEPVDAVLEDGDALEPDGLFPVEGAEEATDGGAIEGEGAGAAIEGGVDAPDWELYDGALGELSGAPELGPELDPEEPDEEPQLDPEEPELAPDPEDAEPVVEPAVDEPPEAPQLPVGGTPLYPALVSTDCPGSGNCRSPPSAVVHPFPIFATNIAGNEAVARS